MRQQRFVVMLPLGLKKRLKRYAAEKDVPMRTVMIQALEHVLGADREGHEEMVPGTQRGFEEPR